MRDGRIEQELLAFRGTTTIQARGRELSVQLDSSGRSWALESDLLERYELPFAWDASHRRLLIGAMDVIQPSVRTVFRLMWVGRCLRCRSRAAQPR